METQNWLCPNPKTQNFQILCRMPVRLRHNNRRISRLLDKKGKRHRFIWGPHFCNKNHDRVQKLENVMRMSVEDE